jgi:hypothetical protein
MLVAGSDSVPWRVCCWAGDVAQAVKCLPSKGKALSSNLSTTKGKEGERNI